MTGHVKKVLQVAIVRGIEQLHATVKFVMEIFLTNTNPRVNDIRSTDVKEILLIWTLGANPISTIGANPIAAMGIDITEMDTTSNPKQHRGGACY